jgi:hypothetical protein
MVVLAVARGITPFACPLTVPEPPPQLPVLPSVLKQFEELPPGAFTEGVVTTDVLILLF